MTVGEMLDKISSAELTEWMAYYQLDPFGNERNDLHSGIIASTVVNSQRTKKSDKVYVPKDFMPDYDREPIEPEKPEVMEEKAKIIAQMFSKKRK
jgi:hypothetical protein